MNLSLLTLALTTGLLGSGHCIGMCGGVVAALSLSGDPRNSGWLFHLCYNLGRILTYGVIGAAVGLLGSAIAYTDIFSGLSRAVLIGADLFLIVIGVGTALPFRHLSVMDLEWPGPTRLLGAAVRRLKTFSSPFTALPIGMVMGLLPCGFLYAMAIPAAQSADPLQGSLTLLAFGAGTLPALVLFGGTARWLSRQARTWMLRGAGLAVAAMGVVQLVKHWQQLG